MQKRVFGRARSQLADTLLSCAPVPGGFSQIESYELEYAQVEMKKGVRVVLKNNKSARSPRGQYCTV